MITLFFEPSRLLISLVAIVTLIGGLLADFVIPETAHQHIRNPHWPPHAKFHNGQTISLGILLGALALFLLWVQLDISPFGLVIAALVASLYWVALLGAGLFPGTAWVDPEFADTRHTARGLAPQFVLSLILLAILVVSIVLKMVNL